MIIGDSPVPIHFSPNFLLKIFPTIFFIFLFFGVGGPQAPLGPHLGPSLLCVYLGGMPLVAWKMNWCGWCSQQAFTSNGSSGLLVLVQKVMDLVRSASEVRDLWGISDDFFFHLFPVFQGMCLHS